MSRSRLRYLDEQLNRDDLTDLQFESFNTEANAIQEQLNKEEQERKAILAARRREEQEDAELEKVLSLTEEEVEKMCEDSCLKYQDVNGVSFREWYHLSLRYYTIDATHNVFANARSSLTVEVIPHPTLAQAKLTILRRIKYKFYDHAVRGRDFAWDIDKHDS
jgi:hypothetical protein